MIAAMKVLIFRFLVQASVFILFVWKASEAILFA